MIPNVFSNSSFVFGICSCSIASVFCGSGLTPSSDTMCPKNFTESVAMWHFFAPNVMFALSKRSNTVLSMVMCSVIVLDAMSRSSMYVKTDSHFRSPNTLSINLQNMAEAVFSPMGMRLYMNNPSGVLNAVSSCDRLVSGTVQNASFMSKLVKYLFPANAENWSCVEGNVYASGLIDLFSIL